MYRLQQKRTTCINNFMKDSLYNYYIKALPIKTSLLDFSNNTANRYRYRTSEATACKGMSQIT